MSLGLKSDFCGTCPLAVLSSKQSGQLGFAGCVPASPGAAAESALDSAQAFGPGRGSPLALGSGCLSQ